MVKHNFIRSNIQLIPQKNSNTLYTVKLSLENETRYIGTLDTSGNGTFITVRKKNHLFRKRNSLGISYELLKDETIVFKNIIVVFEGANLESTREYFIEKGFVVNFSNKGYELQIHVPIDELNKESIRRFEYSKGLQQNLFS